MQKGGVNRVVERSKYRVNILETLGQFSDREDNNCEKAREELGNLLNDSRYTSIVQFENKKDLIDSPLVTLGNAVASCHYLGNIEKAHGFGRYITQINNFLTSAVAKIIELSKSK